MKALRILSALFVSALCLSARAVIYVDDDAPDGGDGSSWANAYRNLPDAVTAANALEDASQRIIFVAKGVYTVVTSGNNSWCILGDKTRVYGGFAGTETGTVEQMLACRDVDENQSIITGDKDKKNDAWIRSSHAYTEWDYPTSEKTTLPIIDFESKKVNIPTDVGELDTYDYVFDTGNAYNNTWIDIQTGCSATVDGLWFTSQNASWGGAIRALGGDAQTEPCIVNNCRFYGFRSRAYAESAHKNCDNYLTNCKFFGGTCSPVAFTSSLYISNCTFRAISMGTVNRGGLINCSGTGATIIDCTFTHCVVRNGSATDRQALLFGGQWGACDLRRSVVSNNLVIAASTGPVGLFGCGQSVVEKTLFANNRQNSRVSGGAVVSMVVAANGRATAHADQVAVDGCAFVSNMLHAAAANGALPGTCYLGTVGSISYTKNDTAIVNSSFFDNVVELEPVADLTAVRSRGVLVDATVADMGAVGIVNCAFAGSAALGVYDVLQQGMANTRPLYIVNSVFTTEAETADPFLFSYPSSVTVDSCTVKRGTAPSGIASCASFSAQEVPLALQPSSSGCALALRPAVKTPEARQTADVGVVSDVKSTRTFAFLPTGTSTWKPLLPHQSTSVAVTRNLDDAFAEGRVAGTMTRGPVQTLSTAAESGVSFSVLCEPVGAGEIDGDSVQCVQPGSSPATVTALPKGGASFVGWFEVGSETAFSESPVLNYAAISDHKTVIAKFGTPKIDLTFDLGSAGTFNENGETSIVKKVSSGTLPVPVPPYVLVDKMIDLGWSPSTNVASPSVATTYKLKAVTTDLRSVYVVPGGAGRKDGTDWDNAYGDLSAAWADAGIYRGELFVKGGEYVLTAGFTPCANVAVHGAVDDVQTVLKGSAVDYLLSAAVGSVVTNVCFENVTFDSFRYGVADLSAVIGSSVSFTACVFTNNNTTCNGIVVQTKGPASFTSCQFLGNYQVFRADQVSGEHFPVLFNDCLFSGNSAERNGGACISLGGGYEVCVTNCVFRKNRSWTSYNWTQACFLSYGSPATVVDCLFEENHADSTTMSACDGIVWIGAGRLERCRFIRNKATPKIAARATAGLNISGDPIVRDCSFVSNIVTATTASADKTYALAAAVCHVGGRPGLLNCSFIDNQVTGTAGATDGAGAVVATVGKWDCELGLAHCAFRGTVLDVTGTSRKGAVCALPGSNNGGNIGLVNCLAADTTGGTGLYVTEGLPEPFLHANALNGYDESVDPLFAAKPSLSPSGVEQLTIRGESPYARGGRPVYVYNSFLYAYLPEVDANKPYIQVSYPASHSASLPGVSPDTPPEADAFGAARSLKKIGYGPVNPPPFGLMLLVR